MHLTRAFRHAGRLPSILFASALLLASSCAHVRAQTAQTTSTLGELKTAVLLVNFQDNTSQPITRADAHTLVFGSVSDFYWEGSYEKTFLSGNTYGWLTIPVSTNTCDTPAIAREGNAAAAAAGIDLTTYSQVVYLFPFNACNFSGANDRGDRGENRVFINGPRTFKTIAHELGHRYGLAHSDSLDCGTVSLGSSCTQNGYGDQADTMGNRGAHFNAFHKERLGWFNLVGGPILTTVTASGRYTLEPYETKTPGIKALKILKATDPASGQKTWYYVEYRQPIGFDTTLTDAGGNLTTGLLIRTGTMTSGGFGTSLLLDMTPNSDNSTASSDVKDGALAAGRSYVDADAGVTITLVSADAAGAVVDIGLGSTAPLPTCTRAAPTLSLTGPTAAIAAGSTVNYMLSLSNKDSSACAATTFNLARSIPSGWIGTLSASSLSLSPGATASATLSVTSTGTATAGGYSIGAGTSSSTGSTHTANASIAYTVAAAAPGGGTLTETVGTDKGSYLRGQSVYMSALVKNNGVAVSGASVQFNVILPTGAVTVMNATSGIDGYARSTYKSGKGKGAIGSYTVRADASNDGSTATASASFSVN